MVKLIAMPKLDHACVKRIAWDETCAGLLPKKPVVTIFICQDGRCPADRTSLQHEAQYFGSLYTDKNKLDMPNVNVICRPFSFYSSPDTLRNHLRELKTCDIFYMTGFSRGQSMPDELKAVFENHVRRGPDERDQSCDRENLVRAIVSRVQYNQMVYMGACGGAMCAGKFLLWPLGRELGPLFDFCMGISIQYDAGLPPESCNTNVIDHKTFLITGGAGLAVHIEHDTVAASSFPSTSKTKWVEWCKMASSAHQTVVGAMAGACTGPWWCDEVGIWHFRLDGRMLRLPPAPKVLL